MRVAVWANRALASDGPATKNVVAILIRHEHQIRPTQLASLAQFESKDLGLTYCKFRARKSVSVLIGENSRTVQDMEKVFHHPFQ
jgi:hypothetical protein